MGSFRIHQLIQHMLAGQKLIHHSNRQRNQQITTVIIATSLCGVMNLSTVKPANADISGLTPCSESKVFAKRKKQELKELQKRLKKYDADSTPGLALRATMEKTDSRFDFYSKSGLLCGTDGLPHLIA